jgi:hypothetical protein
MTKETLEGAAANLVDPNICKTENWIAGAKWQQERMYSEEDLIDAFNEGQALNVRGRLIQGKQWFEKFKKK